MIHAYDEVYLEKASTALGRMLDFAVYDLQYAPDTFFSLFLSTGVAERFGDGEFRLLVGMSAKNIGQAGHLPIINGNRRCLFLKLQNIFR